MRKLVLNPRLRKKAADITSDSFEDFSYVTVDKEHQRNALFTCSLLRACVDSHDGIIDDPAETDNEGFPPLRNNMRGPPPLEERTSSRRNRALIAVVSLAMLCYARSERSNLVQRVNSQFAFANNVPKQFVESFHQMGILVSYESIRCGLQTNAKTIMDIIVDKTRSSRFFISYDNMNFYENARDQRIFNRSSLVNYTAGYICFMKTPNMMEDMADSWEEQYIDSNQVDQKLVNELTNEDFDLSEADFTHQSAAIRYTISDVLGQYFATAMRRQKNDRNIPIYRKWPSPLPDVRCKLEPADILPLPTFAFNEGTIAGTIDIFEEIAKRLELTDEVVRDKLIILKGDLMTV